MWRRPPGPLGQGGAVKISKLRWTLCYSEPALLTVVKVFSLAFWISPVIYSWNKTPDFNNSKANLNRDFGSSTKPVWCSGWPLQVSWLCYADAPVESERWMESPKKSQIYFPLFQIISFKEKCSTNKNDQDESERFSGFHVVPFLMCLFSSSPLTAYLHLRWFQYNESASSCNLLFLPLQNIRLGVTCTLMALPSLLLISEVHL